MYEAHCPCMFNIWVNAQGSGSQCVGQLPLGVLYDCRSCGRNEKVLYFLYLFHSGQKRFCYKIMFGKHCLRG